MSANMKLTRRAFLAATTTTAAVAATEGAPKPNAARVTPGKTA